MPKSDIAQAITLTAELLGQQLSKDAVRLFVSDLEGYDEAAILSALTRCRREGVRRLVPAEIINRMQAADGRPGPEEAWAMMPHGEDDSCVWSDEMRAAFFVIADNPDRVSARVGFIEKYKAEVFKAREEKIPVKWSCTLGHDVGSRERVLLEAVSKGRLTLEQATKHGLGTIETKRIAAQSMPATIAEILDDMKAKELTP
jgi:hypothetical protein